VTTMSNSHAAELSPAVRARAHHRRAKARLALGDTTGALDDSKSAAFLGDRNAVALYGRLMRESGDGGIFGGGGDAAGGMESLFSSSSSPFESMFSGKSPFADSGGGGGLTSESSSGVPSMDMLSSLLGSSGGPSDGSSSSPMPFNPIASMLGSSLGGNSGDGAGGGMGSLAKSVLSSVSKRIEDESTQTTVCNYLNSVDTPQIIGLSTMAGIPLSESTAGRIVKFANGVTPRGINKTVKFAKRILFVGKLLRKIKKFLGKHKHLIVLFVFLGWAKSAISRPVILSKKATEAISKASFNL